MRTRHEWWRDEMDIHMRHYLPGGIKSLRKEVREEYRTVLDAMLEAEWTALQLWSRLKALREDISLGYSYSRRTGPVVYEVCQDCGNRQHACVCVDQAEAESEWDRR